MKANNGKEGQGNAKKKGLETKKNLKNQPSKIINSTPVQIFFGADPAS